MIWRIGDVHLSCGVVTNVRGRELDGLFNQGWPWETGLYWNNVVFDNWRVDDDRCVETGKIKYFKKKSKSWISLFSLFFRSCCWFEIFRYRILKIKNITERTTLLSHAFAFQLNKKAKVLLTWNPVCFLQGPIFSLIFLADWSPAPKYLMVKEDYGTSDHKLEWEKNYKILRRIWSKTLAFIK